MTPEIIDSRLRRFLLGLTTFMFAGTVGELLLQEHYNETLQLIPFGLCALGLVALIAAQVRPNRTTLLALRGAMALVAAGGLLGMWLHLSGNYAFEAEIRPNAAFGELILDTLRGANPLLAPGILVFASVIAAAATYYHPALSQRS